MPLSHVHIMPLSLVHIMPLSHVHIMPLSHVHIMPLLHACVYIRPLYCPVIELRYESYYLCMLLRYGDTALCNSKHGKLTSLLILSVTSVFSVMRAHALCVERATILGTCQVKVQFPCEPITWQRAEVGALL